MKYDAGDKVLVSGGGLSGRPRPGVVDVDYDGCGDVLVVLAGKTKPRAIDARRVRPAEKAKLSPGDKPVSPRVRVVPVPDGPAAVLRAVPKPPPPARNGSYLAFVRAHSCMSCKATCSVEAHHWARRGRTAGLGRKPSDYRTVPLCSVCHSEYHATGHLPGCNRAMSIVLMQDAQIDLLEEWVRDRKVRAHA